jgi:hypothetical protein
MWISSDLTMVSPQAYPQLGRKMGFTRFVLLGMAAKHLNWRSRRKFALDRDAEA